MTLAASWDTSSDTISRENECAFSVALELSNHLREQLDDRGDSKSLDWFDMAMYSRLQWFAEHLRHLRMWGSIKAKVGYFTTSHEIPDDVSLEHLQDAVLRWVGINPEWLMDMRLPDLQAAVDPVIADIESLSSFLSNRATIEQVQESFLAKVRQIVPALSEEYKDRDFSGLGQALDAMSAWLVKNYLDQSNPIYTTWIQSGAPERLIRLFDAIVAWLRDLPETALAMHEYRERVGKSLDHVSTQ